jgi:importin subunit alpha-2
VERFVVLRSRKTTSIFWVFKGVLKPFCDLLAAKDDKTVGVVLDGIANILTTAEKLNETDKVAMMVEECGGLDKIEQLQSHENEQIYHKALQIIETFFPDGDQVESRTQVLDTFIKLLF